MKIIVETRQNPETEARGNDLANHLPKMEAHLGFSKVNLSSELGARQAQREVVKIKNFDFSYWA